MCVDGMDGWVGGWVGAGRLATVKGVGCCEGGWVLGCWGWVFVKGFWGWRGVAWYGMVGGSGSRRLRKIGDAFSKKEKMN